MPENKEKTQPNLVGSVGSHLAEAKGFEPLYRLRGNRISSAGRYDHFDTLPYYSVCLFFFCRIEVVGVRLRLG